jgi:hypothetical protein
MNSHMISRMTILSRIKWCRRQRTRARTQSELEGWRAEEEGLRDGLLRRDLSKSYRSSVPAVFERYVMGFQDAQALIRVALVDQQVSRAFNMTQAPWQSVDQVRSDADGHHTRH